MKWAVLGILNNVHLKNFHNVNLRNNQQSSWTSPLGSATDFLGKSIEWKASGGKFPLETGQNLTLELIEFLHIQKAGSSPKLVFVATADQK